MLIVAMATITVLAYVEYEMLVHLATVTRRTCAFTMG